MTVKLSQVQTALIGAAARRADHCFVAPEGRGNAAARRAASALLASGLAREVQARGDAPVWRRDKDGPSAFALKLTAAGRKAAAKLTAAGVKAAASRDDVGERGAERQPRNEISVAARRDEGPAKPDAEAIAKEQTSVVVAPRSGSKIDHVVKMLSRPEGATLVAIVAATGWQPHTTYAALTGLRKRGYALERSRPDEAGPSVYRLPQSIRSEV